MELRISRISQRVNVSNELIKFSDLYVKVFYL